MQVAQYACLGVCCATQFLTASWLSLLSLLTATSALANLVLPTRAFTAGPAPLLVQSVCPHMGTVYPVLLW